MVRLEDKNNNSIPFTRWNFPGGEVGVKLTEPDKIPAIVHVVVYGIPTSEDMFVTFNLLDALNSAGTIHDRFKVYVDMDYFPYARQDRVCHPGESHALKVFVQMLSTFNDYHDGVIICDPHSKVTVDLLKQYGVKHIVFHQAECYNMRHGYDYVIAPDKGAVEKAKHILYDTPHICLEKVRTENGVEYKPFTDVNLNGKRCIVVDDIFDGGATFISLAKMLKALYPSIQLDLYVTHGIFSKGIDDVLKFYNKVGVYNLMNDRVDASKLVTF